MNAKALVFLVVEDHPEVAQNNCDWLARVDERAHCAIAETPEQALERLKLETPDLVVADLLFGRVSGGQSAQSGLMFLQHIFNHYDTLNVLIYSSDPSLLKPLIKGINLHGGGFVVVNKMGRRSSFLEGASSALRGELRIPRELRQEIHLSDRELEILIMLCQDYLSDRSIAERLHVSLRTAQGYVQRIKEKLDVGNIDENDMNLRVAVCMEAVRRKLLLI
jgi:DNA-binding NarL/FixJ family response regulator